MEIDIKVPSFGESVTEAVVVKILKNSGSWVEKDEEIIELETDKINAAVVAPDSGLLNLQVGLEASVKIGDKIGFIETSHEKPKEEKIVASQEEVKPRPKQSAPSHSSHPIHLTKEAYVAGLSQPFQEALVAPPLSSPENNSIEKGERKKLSPLRKTIAKRLVEVKNQTAMLTTFNEADLAQIIQIRQKQQEDFTKKYGVKLGFMSFFIKACVSALKAFPEVNAYLEGDEIVTFQSTNLSVAVSTDKGLMVPVIRNADQMSFGEIEQSLANLSKKGREGKLSIQDLQGGTFTITNGGVFGSLISTPILNPPQSAILGMHAIQKRAVVVEDQIVIRPMMYLALSYDHRLIDGKEAVGFLVHIKQAIEDPNRLLLDF